MIPDHSRIPFIYVDFDHSKAISPYSTQTYQVLLIGERNSTFGKALTPIYLRNEKDAAQAFGQDSMLFKMAKAFFENNRTSKVYGIAVDHEPTHPPDLSLLLQAIADRQFHIIVNPFVDEASLKVLTQEMESRFSADRQMEGHLFSAISRDEKTLSETHPVIKAVRTKAGKHMTLLASGKSSATPDFVWASAIAGVVSESAQRDPARPFNTLPIHGCLAPLDSDLFERSERSRLLDLGLSTYSVDLSGSPRVERLLTTYYNQDALSDESYLSLNTLLTLSYLRFSFVNYFSAKYPRHKLADDGAILTPGSAILTPNTARCEAIALFLSWQEAGLVEGFDQFKNDLMVTRNKDRSRLDFYMSPRLVSQLQIIGANISFLI